ncbi:unnamed protein product [Psylliodes chrysocephalus]|uniref:glutathione transferase n=1 Tax=Psylliodes chrysocephalus TaxID=3402493 RepID=A0A9P0G8A0_9CUCU|nr:unnamed protein product [Psylliodes chrysocephala]
MPYGQLPTFEHDGKITHQSLAICRYAAKQAKLVGSNDWEDLEIDAAADTINDLRLKIVEYSYEKDPKVKEQRKGPLFKEILPFYVEKFEKQLKKNNGYFAIGKLTWADVYFVGLLEFLNYMLGKDLSDGAPGLKGLNEKVRAIPQIKTYLNKRPKTAGIKLNFKILCFFLLSVHELSWIHTQTNTTHKHDIIAKIVKTDSGDPKT